MWETLLTALRATGIPFAEQAWVGAGNEYGILRLRGAGESVWADGEQQAQASAAAVHLFTRSAGLTQAAEIQQVLRNTNGLSWRQTDIQYEDNTKLTHYTWEVEWV